MSKPCAACPAAGRSACERRWPGTGELLMGAEGPKPRRRRGRPRSRRRAPGQQGSVASSWSATLCKRIRFDRRIRRSGADFLRRPITSRGWTGPSGKVRRKPLAGNSEPLQHSRSQSNHWELGLQRLWRCACAVCIRRSLRDIFSAMYVLQAEGICAALHYPLASADEALWEKSWRMSNACALRLKRFLCGEQFD